METLRGTVLISSGGLYDPNFRHTVVLVGEHTADGAVGVILNRALDVTVEETVPTLAPLVPPGQLLFQGGPVQRESPVLLAEFRDPEWADLPVFGSIGFLVGDIPGDIGSRLLRARVYSGYSGWGPGQLEAELEDGAWILEPPEAEDVFTGDPELLWSRILRRKGPPFDTLSRMPYDPTMN